MKTKLNTAVLLPIIYLLFSIFFKIWIFFDTPNINHENKFWTHKEIDSIAIRNTYSISQKNIIDNSAKSIISN